MFQGGIDYIQADAVATDGGIIQAANEGAGRMVSALDPAQYPLGPPRSPQTNGMVERFNGRIEEVLQSHHFRSGEELETTLHRYVWLYNHQLPQSVLGSKTPLQAIKHWHKLKPDLIQETAVLTHGM
jgi:hypothetical protein